MDFNYIYLVIIASAFVITTYILWSLDKDLRTHRKLLEVQSEQISHLYSLVYNIEDKLSLTEAIKVKYE